MIIHVNGESRGIGDGETVAALLHELEILDRKDFETRGLREGDRVEILSFIGGGAR